MESKNLSSTVDLLLLTVGIRFGNITHLFEEQSNFNKGAGWTEPSALVSIPCFMPPYLPGGAAEP